MKITDMAIIEKTPFGMIEIGETFRYQGDVYIRIPCLMSSSSNRMCNAVDLRNGAHGHFQTDWMVQKLEAELIIKK